MLRLPLISNFDAITSGAKLLTDAVIHLLKYKPPTSYFIMKKRIAKFYLPALTIVLLCVFLSHSSEQTPGLKQADSLYFAKDWVSAKVQYEQVLKDTPDNGVAWNRLGFACYNTGNADAAMHAYSKSLQYGRIAPLRASVYSRMARINSLHGKKEEALNNIDSAISAGYSLYNELDSLKDFAAIRSEPRFKAMRQKTYFISYPCMANTQLRQFDFWVGEWDAYVRGTKQFAGHSVIQIASGGCAILENWTSKIELYNGKSLNYVDPVTKKWKQTWIGQGGLQEFVDGEYRDGAMRFTFETTDPQGHKLIGRFIFYNENPNQVH